MQRYSVFDIIGPRMVGPSSSHTAGAARLAYTVHRLAGYDVRRVAFTLYGSFAETGRGHGTDKALIGGILGFAPDDMRIRDAYELAQEAGLSVELIFSQEPMPHPNTVRIEAVNGRGESIEVLGESIGGGSIRITAINGLSVELTGEYPTLIIQHHDYPGVIARVTEILAERYINIAFMRVFRHAKNADAFMIIETDHQVEEQVKESILASCQEISKVFAV
ncbi:L-serine ammonia-lyase, iron-sulfur-dependent subunit beta [Christensenella sp. MSJ-20]|uniref:L-serine ammonia-lyase, iron-sulfur-dependent subunit beta n=1 Tax=Christensenella sp. MSJ-20 TaxID=2841518 RepID=UPI000D79BA57|nr:MAG: L-serine ammonia-lyase, iron-sulfur-dependent, subunit beta [Bacillota bacterium]QWT55179.1 L-serine ammonia-lyase, iron-sulfur-dependent subunit beta [Christensenella sp. MSJ-20]